MSVPIIGKEQDLPGCICAPVFLQELMGQCDDDVKPSIKTFLELMGELAFFITRVSDPRLRMIGLRLGLFPMPQDQLQKAIEAEMERVKQLEALKAQKAKKAANQEVGDGNPNPVSES